MTLKPLQLSVFPRFLSTLFLTTLLTVSSALAGPIQETVIFKGTPSERQIAEWSAGSTLRNYKIEIETAPPAGLLRLTQLKAASIQVTTPIFPISANLELWKKLAEHGVEFIGTGGGIPLDSTVKLFNQIQFKHIVLVIAPYLLPDESRRLSQIQGSLTLSFAINRYPLYHEKPPLASLPTGVQLIFATDYWPRYHQMDVLNMLPQQIRLRIKDYVVPESSLSYLHNMPRLEEVIVDLDREPTLKNWTDLNGEGHREPEFAPLNVRWNARGFVPSAAGLAAFHESGQKALAGARKLVIDSDDPLTASERERLEKSPLAVEWLYEVH